MYIEIPKLNFANLMKIINTNLNYSVDIQKKNKKKLFLII